MATIISTRLFAVPLAASLALAACGSELPTEEPLARTDLRQAIGTSDVNVVAVTVTPDGSQTFVFDRAAGLVELGTDGSTTVVMAASALPDPGVEVRLPYTDLVALGDDKFAVTAIGDGFLLDTAAQTMALHFCYEPDFIPEDFVQRTDAVTFDSVKNQIIAQPQTFNGNDEIIQSDIGYYDRASGADLDWHSLNINFLAGGMAVGDGGSLYLGWENGLFEYDFEQGVAVPVDDLERFGVDHVDGLAYRASTNSLLVVDGARDELVEIGLDQLAR